VYISQPAKKKSLLNKNKKNNRKKNDPLFWSFELRSIGCPRRRKRKKKAKKDSSQLFVVSKRKQPVFLVLVFVRDAPRKRTKEKLVATACLC